MTVPNRPGPNRRQFLTRAALLAAGTPALIAFLDACSKGAQPSSAPSLTIASPSSPVTWDIAGDNKPIADGLAPEKGATLQLYSYADYIAPDAIKSFEEKYSTKVQVSTFNDTDEALTKIRGGNVDYDLFFPSYDQISRLVKGDLVRSLNHSYIPNIKNVWPFFSNPWYDQEWRYTVPYTVYTTGIGWRTDQVPADIGALKNPYESLWDPAYKNKTAVIDDWHTAMAMVLLKMGITDIKRKFNLEDMASADVVFSATGVTDGSLLKGVHIRGDFAETETVVMRSKTGTVRRIKSRVRNVGSRFS
jgi:spermidine/putrescine transport system substrate-binding protein